MNYLKASFYGDVRFTGTYISQSAAIDDGQYEVYATILHYVITHRLKWQRLLILNVQPSSMTPLKVVRSK